MTTETKYNQATNETKLEMLANAGHPSTYKYAPKWCDLLSNTRLAMQVMNGEVNHGCIKLDNGFEFGWSIEGGEIYGYVVEPKWGSIVKGSSGFYRTLDPHKAAHLATKTLV